MGGSTGVRESLIIYPGGVQFPCPPYIHYPINKTEVGDGGEKT